MNLLRIKSEELEQIDLVKEMLERYPDTFEQAHTVADIERIRKEAMTNSQIMKTMHFLTDVHGPRLTGSPNFKAAAEWTVKQMTEWGFTNGKLEPWDFVNADGTPRPGWVNERFSGHIIAPVKDSLVGEVLAWTPSTKGTVIAEAVHVVPPTRPTQAELDAWMRQETAKWAEIAKAANLKAD